MARQLGGRGRGGGDGSRVPLCGSLYLSDTK